MSATPFNVFEQRIERFDKEIAVVDRELDRIAFIRLFVFIAGAVLQVMSWRWGSWYWFPALLTFLLGFGTVVKWNMRVDRRKRFLQTLRRINELEIGRLQGDFDELAQGEEFISRTHAYSSDLDLFGQHSLYQLLNRTTTRFGQVQLAAWMQQAADRATILGRQEAVAELATKLEWRQRFQAIGEMYEDPGERPESLRKWITEPPILINHPWYPKAPYILPPLTIGTFVLAIFSILPIWVSGIFLLLQVAINRTLKKHSEQVYLKTDKRAKVLKAYAELIETLESEPMEAPLLAEVRGRLRTGGRPANEEIADFARILSSLELRLNGLPYFIMNQLFFWDIIWIQRLEKWKQRHGENIMTWFRAIGEMEALSSMAALRFAYPGWCQPEISELPGQVTGEALGHPMIGVTERVTNPIDLAGKGNVWLITGSNMSGKSTYLRTVGVNIVLALMGAPACATAFRCAPLLVVTSMRTLDSLEENTSSFYAELKRLKMVIDCVRNHTEIFFLLDEILKGTNSRDRHSGARALILQLQREGGTGLVSTHDLDLVQLEQETEGAVVNYSFNCEVTPQGDLNFDYTLTRGQCHSMNATQLMQNMGIEM